MWWWLCILQADDQMLYLMAAGLLWRGWILVFLPWTPSEWTAGSRCRCPSALLHPAPSVCCAHGPAEEDQNTPSPSSPAPRRSPRAACWPQRTRENTGTRPPDTEKTVIREKDTDAMFHFSCCEIPHSVLLKMCGTKINKGTKAVTGAVHF